MPHIAKRNARGISLEQTEVSDLEGELVQALAAGSLEGLSLAQISARLGYAADEVEAALQTLIGLGWVAPAGDAYTAAQGFDFVTVK